MAIIPDVPDIEVSVQINKIPLKEYNHEDDSPASGMNESTTYVESIAGAEFTITVNIGEMYKTLSDAWREHPDFSIWVYLDGNLVKQSFIENSEFGLIARFISCRLIENGERVLRVFMFSDLKIGLITPEVRHMIDV
jgi:hypothetical protein